MGHWDLTVNKEWYISKTLGPHSKHKEWCISGTLGPDSKHKQWYISGTLGPDSQHKQWYIRTSKLAQTFCQSKREKVPLFHQVQHPNAMSQMDDHINYAVNSHE